MSMSSTLRHTVKINGVEWAGDVLVQLLNMVTDPDPTRWYNFQRKDDMITVTVLNDLKKDGCK